MILIALLITLPDALVWSELGAALPGSGGTYRWLREGFGPQTWGRLMAFLFIWQFIISGPMEMVGDTPGVRRGLGRISSCTKPVLDGELVLPGINHSVVANN